jgi:polysaccharide biosynthesis/export protein
VNSSSWRSGLWLAGALVLAGCAADRPRGPNVVDARAVPPPPTTASFRLQVGDKVKIGVWKEDDLESTQSVQADGTISPPLLKSQRVAGLTLDEARARITSAYSEYLIEPKISLNVVSILSDRVFVLGEVKDPAAVPMKGPTTAVASVALAGGFEEEFADKCAIRVIRKRPNGVPACLLVDGEAVLAGAMPDVPLQRGDIVFVPARGVTNWSRTLGQALEPFGVMIGAAGTAVTSYALLSD